MLSYDLSKNLLGADTSKSYESYENNYDKNEKNFNEYDVKYLGKINDKNCKVENAIQD